MVVQKRDERIPDRSPRGPTYEHYEHMAESRRWRTAARRTSHPPSTRRVVGRLPHIGTILNTSRLQSPEIVAFWKHALILVNIDLTFLLADG